MAHSFAARILPVALLGACLPYVSANAAGVDYARDVRPLQASGRAWTDDRAPVEWLTDRMIIEYAAEGGRLDEDYLPTRPGSP